MKKATYCILGALLFFCVQEVLSTCCYGYRKVCESLSDVEEQGKSEWKSLIINPGRCENLVRIPKKETATQLTFNKVPNLTNLYIVDVTFDLQGNVFEPLKDSLVYLSIIKNNLTTIPGGVFENLPRMKKLALRDNNIEKIPEAVFKNVPYLEILLLSVNLIQNVTSGFFNVIDLKNVDLSFNLIKYIDKDAFPDSLIFLNLKRNDLKDIKDDTFLNLNALEMLILSKNKLKIIRKKTFSGLTNLSKLDLSRNEIDTIEEESFSELQELTFLYLKHNNLRVLKAEIFLKDMINLSDLELERNSLTYLAEEIFKRMPNLEEISINGNPWQCKCLDNLMQILNKKNISVSDMEDQLPKCVGKGTDTCVAPV